MAKISRTCQHCNKEFLAEIGQVNRGGGKYCSRICTTTGARGKNIKRRAA
jgi:hypothetical protein